LDPATNWDLCICDLESTELADFSTILNAVRPVMLNGGTIVGFLPNYDAAALAVDGALIDSLSRSWDRFRFYFAGSSASARIIQKFRAAAHSYEGGSYSFIRRMMFMLRLLKMVPETLASNRAEASSAPEGFSTPPPICTSVAIEVVVDPTSEGSRGNQPPHAR